MKFKIRVSATGADIEIADAWWKLHDGASFEIDVTTTEDLLPLLDPAQTVPVSVLQHVLALSKPPEATANKRRGFSLWSGAPNYSPRYRHFLKSELRLVGMPGLGERDFAALIRVIQLAEADWPTLRDLWTSRLETAKGLGERAGLVRRLIEQQNARWGIP